MTRVILRQSVREAYLAADRAVRETAREVEILLAGWRDWSVSGVRRVLLLVNAKLRTAWIQRLPWALRQHLERVRLRTLGLVTDDVLRALIAGALPPLRQADMVRLNRQYRWVVATVEDIVQNVTNEPEVTGQVVAGAVARFLDPRFAQVRYRTGGSVQRRYRSSGAYAGTYARQLFREDTSRVYGETMGAIAAGDPDVIGERCRISSSHVGPDECDEKANADLFGLGRGVYPPGQFPEFPSHRGCLCSRELVRMKGRMAA